MSNQYNELIKTVDLVKEFEIAGGGFFGKNKPKVHATSSVNISIMDGETFALVGESGCGKSTLGRLMLRLIEPTSGHVEFEGVNINELKSEEMREIRRKMQIIFQDPYASINPRMDVYNIIAEPLITHNICGSKEQTKEKVKALMSIVGIRPEFINRYPHQFSGGQRQRIGIARALALQPKLIICDEPVSALDVSIQSQILNLLHDLQDEFKLTYLFISHDLSVIRYISNRVCVMFLGKVCEIGNTEELFKNPLHPYTKFLIDAVPKPDPFLRKENKQLLQGEIPSPVNPPKGCRFHTRCPYAENICKELEPELINVNNRQVACHLVKNV
jgi:oligopeptide transport system ATP-binding protein